MRSSSNARRIEARRLTSSTRSVVLAVIEERGVDVQSLASCAAAGAAGSVPSRPQVAAASVAPIGVPSVASAASAGKAAAAARGFLAEVDVVVDGGVVGVRLSCRRARAGRAPRARRLAQPRRWRAAASDGGRMRQGSGGGRSCGGLLQELHDLLLALGAVLVLEIRRDARGPCRCGRSGSWWAWPGRRTGGRRCRRGRTPRGTSPGVLPRKASASARSWSRLTATMTRPSPPCLRCSSFIQGKDCRQGEHQEAQKSTRTTLPA